MSGQNATYQKENITDPGEHDVMFGRGGGTNNHPGNIKFRKLCHDHKFRYLAASKVDKPKVAREVVAIWRTMTPPGRFLSKNTKTDSLWHDVGDQKAREKASQCLRERTPDVKPILDQLQKQASTSNVANAAIPEVTVSDIQAKQMHEIPFDASAIAVALLNKQVDGKENPMLTAYLQQVAEANDDDMSIDENASVAAIAKALFKNASVDDDNMSIADFLTSEKQMTGDLDSIFSETMSKNTWAKNINLDTDLMSAHSLGRIGENGEPLMPDFIPRARSNKMKYAKSNASTMSGISEMTDVYDDRGTSRATKMAKGKESSNISMMSELTDLTGGFSTMGLES